MAGEGGERRPGSLGLVGTFILLHFPMTRALKPLREEQGTAWKILYGCCRNGGCGCQVHCVQLSACRHVGADGERHLTTPESQGAAGAAGISSHPPPQSDWLGFLSSSAPTHDLRLWGEEGAGSLHFDRENERKKRPCPAPRLSYFHFNFVLGVVGSQEPEAIGLDGDRWGTPQLPWPLAVATHHLSPGSVQVGPWTLLSPGRSWAAAAWSQRPHTGRLWDQHKCDHRLGP